VKKSKTKPKSFWSKKLYLPNLPSTSVLLNFGAIFLCLFALCSANTPQISIVWSTENFGSSVPLLKNISGHALTAGVQGNGDGCLVELGYYSESTTSHPFAGDWIALTRNTHVGDSSTGYGFDDGKFAFSTTFSKDRDTVVIFPTEPKVFVETLDFTVTSFTPPVNIPICIRFYDTVEKSPTSKYNAVTGPDWKWPSFPSGSSIPGNVYFKISNASPPSGTYWKYGSTFEDPDNPFVASKPQSFRVGISLSPYSSGMGSITDINGTFSAGSYIDVNASVVDHHEFYMWSGGTFLDPYNPNTKVYVDGTLDIKAEIYPAIYYIGVPEEQEFQIEGWGPHDYGTEIVLSASPPFGYSFSHWAENDINISNQNPYSFSINGDRNFTAVYNPLAFNVSFSGNGGSIESIQDVNGDTPTHFLYDHNYTILLRPNLHYEFSEWSSGTSSLAPLTNPSGNPLEWQFSPQSNASYEANFKIIENYLWIHEGTGGTTNLKTGMFLAIDENMPINATPQQGYKFSYWSDPFGILSELNSSSTEANISKIDISAEITANFELLDYNLTDINITATDGGRYTLESVASGKYKHFSRYSLVATSFPGYQFDRWMGDGNLSNLVYGPSAGTNEIIIDGPITLVASFVPSLYQLSTSSEPAEAGFVSGGGGFSILDSLAVEAQPNPFWNFESWSGDTEFLVSADSAGSIIQWPDGSSPRDLNLTAHFSRETIQLDATINGQGSLRYSISSNGEITQSSDSSIFISTELFAEDNLLIEGLPSLGWEFKNWTGLPRTDDLIAFDFIETYLEVASFSSAVDINISANFIRSEFALTISNSSQGGESTGSGIYPFEEFVEINATPKPHFTFNGWTGPGTEYLELPTSTMYNELFIPPSDTELTAVFEPIRYSLTLESGNHGSVTSLATYDGHSHSGLEINGTSNVVISSDPEDGYVFQAWEWEKSDGTSGTFYNPTFIIPKMDGNYSLLATFKLPETDLVYSLTNNLESGGTTEEIKHLATQSKRSFLAQAYEGYSFLGWTSDQPAQIFPNWSTNAVEINLSDGTTITANYRKDAPKLMVDFDPRYGTVGMSKSTSFDDLHTLTASPLENYEFSSWDINKTQNLVVQREYSKIYPEDSRLFIDGNESPELTLIRGFSYTFALDLSPDDEFFLAVNPDNSPADAYTEGVTNQPTFPRTMVFDIPPDSPDTLYYNGSQFPYSGNRINIISINESDIIPYPKNPLINVQIPANLELVANFVPVELDFEISKRGEGEVIKTVDKFFYGDEIELSAIPSEHWLFSHWEGDVEILEPANPDISVEIFADSQLIANFIKKPYRVEIVSSPSDFGNSYTPTNVYTFYNGDEVEIKAVAKEGKVFSHWSAPILSNRQNLAETSFVLEQNTALTAHFKSIEYNMSYNVVVLDKNSNVLTNQFAGFVAANDSYLDEDVANFKFIINQGYDFLYWKNAETNQTLSTDLSFPLEISRNLDIDIFVQKQSHQVNLSLIPSERGKVSLLENDYNDSASFTVDHGEELSLFATPNEGYTFQKWVSFSGLLPFPSNPSLKYTVKDDIHIAAYFVPLEDVELKIIIEPSDAGWATGAGTFGYNAKHPISAAPLRGWVFDRWVGNGIENESLRATQVNLNENKTIIAQFKEDPDGENSSGSNSSLFVLLVSSTDDQMGETSGSGIYTTAWNPITATPLDGYDFSHWEGENIENIYSPTTRTYTDSSKQVFAHFIRSGILEDSTNLQDAWWSNPWLGNYWKQKNSNWIFHEKLGWSFITRQETTSVWLWIEKLDHWFWTSQTTYPYIYSSTEGWHWILLERSNPNMLFIYRFETPAGWISF